MLDSRREKNPSMFFVYLRKGLSQVKYFTTDKCLYGDLSRLIPLDGKALKGQKV